MLPACPLMNFYPPPPFPLSTMQPAVLSTNAAYLQLQKVRTIASRQPVKYYYGFGDTTTVRLPVDRTVSDLVRSDRSRKMIAGLDFGQADIRRYLFCSLVASVGDKVRYDAFEAIAASLYTEGKFNTNEDDPFSHQEMTLELRLNAVAFY